MKRLYWDEWTEAEIAHELGISQQAVSKIKRKSHPETEGVVGGVVVRGASSLTGLPLSRRVVKSASWCILLSGDEQRMWRQVGLWLLVIGLLGANLWTLGRPSEILMALHLSLYPIGG
jgi:hypothetical protein